MSFGLYAFVPGRFRRRLEPWSTVVLGGLLTLFLISAGILSFVQAPQVTAHTNHGFRSPRTPTQARLGGIWLISLGLLPASGVVMTVVRHVRGATRPRGRSHREEPTLG